MIASQPRAFAERTESRPAVKICGIMQPEHALMAAQYGADMIGLVFARSRRQLSIEAARHVRMALDSISPRPLVVGVFVNETPERMRETALEVGLDILQLSGDEPTEDVSECASSFPVIKGLRFPQGVQPENAKRALDTYVPSTPAHNIRFLIDTYRSGEYGGTGEVADWSLAASLASRFDIMLAGGLNPRNVGDAIAQVSPWGVDVSSGVETGGAKDVELIREFIENANEKGRLTCSIRNLR